MKKLILILIALCLTLSLVSAVEGDLTEIIFMAPDLEDLDSYTDLSEEELVEYQKEMVLDNLNLIQEEFNSNEGEPSGALEYINYIFDGERVNIELEGNYTIGLVYSDYTIEELVPYEIEDASLEVSISDDLFTDYNNGELDLTKALEDNVISFEGIGFWNKIKFTLLEILISLIQTFS